MVLEIQAVVLERELGGEMGHVDSFLSRNQSPFPEKFELDDYLEKAFPTLSNSLKGVVSQKFQWALAPDSLVMHSFQVN